MRDGIREFQYKEYKKLGTLKSSRVYDWQFPAGTPSDREINVASKDYVSRSAQGGGAGEALRYSILVILFIGFFLSSGYPMTNRPYISVKPLF